MGTTRGATETACALLIGTLLLLTGCGSSGSPASNSPSPTNVTVSMSDPPTCSSPSGPFAHIYVTITDVKIHASASAGPNDPGWVDLTPSLSSSPQQIDLLAQANNQCFLATLGSTTEIQPGSYQQIRIYLAANNASVA